jgi:membrane-bound serine protease (ClpP class)
MDPFLVWGLALLGVAAILLAAEVFIPSGGIIAGLSGISAIAGIVCLFRYETTWGVIGILLALVLGPVIFFVGLNIWKNTEFGRRAIGAPSEEEISKQALDELAARKKLEALIGAKGVALTDLRPVGLVMVGGERRDALAETTFIAAGTRVRVTVVETHQVKVRPIHDSATKGGDAGMATMDHRDASAKEAGVDGGADGSGGDGGGCGDGGGGGDGGGD